MYLKTLYQYQFLFLANSNLLTILVLLVVSHRTDILNVCAVEKAAAQSNKIITNDKGRRHLSKEDIECSVDDTEDKDEKEKNRIQRRRVIRVVPPQHSQRGRHQGHEVEHLLLRLNPQIMLTTLASAIPTILVACASQFVPQFHKFLETADHVDVADAGYDKGGSIWDKPGGEENGERSWDVDVGGKNSRMVPKRENNRNHDGTLMDASVQVNVDVRRWKMVEELRPGPAFF